jgi:hypothetical protein
MHAPALWRYAPQAQAALDAGGIEGFAVEADDGPLGTITCACDDGEGAFIVSSGGAWNGGLSAMFPAGLVERVDAAARRVVLRCSREQIRSAPAFENDRYRDGAFRREMSSYYGFLFPSAFPLFEAATRRAGTLLSFGRDTRGYPQATVS